VRAIIWAVLIIGGFLLGVIGLEKRDQKTKRRYAPQDGDNPAPESGGHHAAFPDAIANAHPSEEEHRTAELQHWLAERTYYKSQFVIGLITLVFAAIAAGGAVRTYVQTKRQANAAVDAADAARDQAENMDRPWIKMVLLERPDIRFTGPGMATQFGFPGEKPQVFFNGSPQIRNVGKTTAIHVHARIKLVIHKWENGWGDFSSEQKAACADAQAMNGGYDATLFPDDPFDGFGTADGGLSIAG
jgi:hypothetical protein